MRRTQFASNGNSLILLHRVYRPCIHYSIGLSSAYTIQIYRQNIQLLNLWNASIRTRIPLNFLIFVYFLRKGALVLSPMPWMHKVWAKYYNALNMFMVMKKIYLITSYIASNAVNVIICAKWTNYVVYVYMDCLAPHHSMTMQSMHFHDHQRTWRILTIQVSCLECVKNWLCRS